RVHVVRAYDAPVSALFLGHTEQCSSRSMFGWRTGDTHEVRIALPAVVCRQPVAGAALPRDAGAGYARRGLGVRVGLAGGAALRPPRVDHAVPGAAAVRDRRAHPHPPVPPLRGCRAGAARDADRLLDAARSLPLDAARPGTAPRLLRLRERND